MGEGDSERVTRGKFMDGYRERHFPSLSIPLYHPTSLSITSSNCLSNSKVIPPYLSTPLLSPSYLPYISLPLSL